MCSWETSQATDPQTSPLPHMHPPIGPCRGLARVDFSTARSLRGKVAKWEVEKVRSYYRFKCPLTFLVLTLTMRDEGNRRKTISCPFCAGEEDMWPESLDCFGGQVTQTFPGWAAHPRVSIQATPSQEMRWAADKACITY